MNSLKVITAAGGQNSVTQMIGSLYDAIEDHYGIFASRLYRAFRPKPLKSTATSSWRKMCCLPYAYIYMVCNKYDPQRGCRSGGGGPGLKLSQSQQGNRLDLPTALLNGARKSEICPTYPF